MCAFLTLFLAFGLGLDPRNASTFGPSLAPILIGLSSAITIFAGATARPGYLGACMSPSERLRPDPLVLTDLLQLQILLGVWDSGLPRTTSLTIMSTGLATSLQRCKFGDIDRCIH